MTHPIHALLDLLELESIEHNIYRGRNRDVGTGRIYGGQVLAQSLVAARRTVDPDRPAHSLHGYFILAGDLEIPVVYFVDRLRDGGSFSTRRVTAIQHGRAIYNMSASFHGPEESVDHQSAIPEVPAPEELRPEIDLLREGSHRLPEEIREVLTQERPLDIRPVDQTDPFDPEPSSPTRRYWIRTRQPLSDDRLQHQAVLAYASDYGLLGAALRPHGVTYRQPDVMVASLDHAVWFHRPFRVDDWLLYDIESPSAAGARAFSRGSVYARSGELVASTAQEGLLRMGTDPRD